MTDEQTTARKDMAKIVNAMLALIAFSEQYGENGEEPMLFNEIIQIAKSAIPLAESLPGKIEALEQDRDDARRELSDAPDPADARLAALEIGLLKEKIASERANGYANGIDDAALWLKAQANALYKLNRETEKREAFIEAHNAIRSLSPTATTPGETVAEGLGPSTDAPKSQLAVADAENERLREALAPFASLRVARLMTSGLKYDFRIDAGDIRKAIAALTGAPPTSEDSPGRL